MVDINFVFNTFLYLEPVQRVENMAGIGGSASCNVSTSNLSNIILESGYVEGNLTASAEDSSIG